MVAWQPIPIESADDVRVADYVGLRNKESEEFLIAESAPVVARLLGSRFRVRSLLVTPKGLARLGNIAAAPDAPLYVAEPTVMEAITGFDVHRGVLASADRRPNLALGELLSTATRLVVLEGSNDHENIGVVARSARALGFDGMILDPTCADPYYRRSVRVSMGEILHLPIVRCTTWPAPLAEIIQRGFDAWALTPDVAAADLFTKDVPAKVAVVAGAERHGLAADARAMIANDVRIPMHHGVDSLNLGHALAITMAFVSSVFRT